jgi:hypothetical protein
MPAQSHAVFQLPGGLVLDGRLEQTVELRPLTGLEEDWLASHPAAPSALAVTEVLASCLVRLGDRAASPSLVSSLLVGDRDFLMLQLRRLTLGDRIQAIVECPTCAARADIDFNASGVAVEHRPQTTGTHTYRCGEPPRDVVFRLPTGADQAAVVHLPLGEAAAVLLERCLLDDGDRPLSQEERAAVTDEMERVAPRADIELDVVCPECGHEFLVPFDVPAFFFREMRLAGRQLLREVHLLALYYHWTEPEILRLERSRRRAYLDLLSETMRTEATE